MIFEQILHRAIGPDELLPRTRPRSPAQHPLSAGTSKPRASWCSSPRRAGSACAGNGPDRHGSGRDPPLSVTRLPQISDEDHTAPKSSEAICPAQGWRAICLSARRTEDGSTLAQHDVIPLQERRVAEAVPDEDPAELIREVLAIEREITAGLEKLLGEVE